MALAAGTRLGPYEIVAPLGAGGMGEVYRARDGRLGRDVSVKVLPTALADDPSRRRRFELEARAAGALNHPSVLAVLDVGVEGSTAYLVTELLDGETLRSKLAGGTPPLRKAIEWAVQIAQGLAAVHDKGIVHRDLKPENLFVTRDGRVKILDFGLAKAVTVGDAAAGSDPESTLAEGPTSPGAVLGSAGYMAPEQVTGKSVDARTDLFAFGAVLYELLTGRRAFGEGTQVERAYAILKDDPPAPTNPEVSPALELVLRRCLEKSPEERFQSARDLAFHLQSVSTTSGHGSSAPLVTSLRPVLVPRVALIGAVIATAVAAAIPAFVLGRRDGHLAPIPGANLAPAAATSPARYTRLTFRNGLVTNARFVPDGRSIVYSTMFSSGRPQILTVTAGQPDSRVLGDNLSILAMSSTSELAVAIPSASPLVAPTLGRMALGASTPRAVLEGVSHADWAPDGTHLAVVLKDHTSQRVEYPLGHVLAKVTGEIGRVRVSPDGKLVAFEYWPTRGDDRGSVELVDAHGARRTVAGPFGSLRGLAWSADGRKVWFAADSPDALSGLAIHAATLDGQDRVVTTVPVRVTLQDRAADGRMLVYLHSAVWNEIHFRGPGDTGDRDLSWFDGSMLTDVSADGKTLLFAEGRESSNWTREYMIYMRSTSGGPAVPLGPGVPYALSPDGKWILLAPRMPRVALELLPTGAGQPRALPKGAIVEYGEFGGFFPGGERIWFLGRDHDVDRLWVQDLAAGDPRPLVDRAVFTIARGLSPDGKTFLLRDPSDGSFFELDATGGAPRPRTLPVGTVPLGWTSDGALYLVRRLSDATSWAVTRWDPTTRREKAVRTLRGHSFLSPDRGGYASPDLSSVGTCSDFSVSPDGSWYAFQCIRVHGDLYVIEGLE